MRTRLSRTLEETTRGITSIGSEGVQGYHETAVRSAFQNLLAAFAQSANWMLIPEQTLANGKRRYAAASSCRYAEMLARSLNTCRTPVGGTTALLTARSKM